eukprot:2685-Chlamydomonas_euryale.AAC.1
MKTAVPFPHGNGRFLLGNGNGGLRFPFPTTLNDAALKFSTVKGNPGEAVAEFLPRFSQAHCLATLVRRRTADGR